MKAGNVAGLLAYAGGEPVGWVAIEPREAYPRLARSRTLAPVDDRRVWSITCFFVARPARGKGVTRALIDGAVRYARTRGAAVVEAYPVDLGREVADAWVYTGAASTFRELGFREVARRSRTRPIVRKEIRRSRAGAGRGARSARASPAR